MQTQLGHVDAVDVDGAAGRLDDAEQRQGQRRLAGARPTHDPDLCTDTTQHVNTPVVVWTTTVNPTKSKGKTTPQLTSNSTSLTCHCTPLTAQPIRIFAQHTKEVSLPKYR